MLSVMDPDDVSLPALLRAARRTYGERMRASLTAAGLDDVPSNGMFVIGAIGDAPAPLGDVIAGLGISKQAAGQLVDTLVLRGYVERQADPDDRRRLILSATERGRAAAEIVWRSGAEVDAELEAAVGSEAVATTRGALLALIAIRER
jgi:DNA-binding MarR family transcriptional regulator